MRTKIRSSLTARGALLTLSCMLGATGCASTDDVATDEDDIARAGKVAGYDLTGPRIAPALGARMACPQRATVVSDACIALRGVTTFTRTCEVLCSVPVAAAGKIAGFDLNGFQAGANEIAPTGGCPEVIDAVTTACIAVRGRTSTTASCATLCSVPVAERGKVAGFDLTGYKNAEALPSGYACPQRADAVTDACIAKLGNASYTRGCDVLCSTPIAR